jgi:hypothetical protein
LKRLNRFEEEADPIRADTCLCSREPVQAAPVGMKLFESLLENLEEGRGVAENIAQTGLIGAPDECALDHPSGAR